MKLAIICLLTVAVIPQLLTFLAVYFRQTQLGVIDNKSPRKQYQALEGVGQRAVAAQQNTWEALALYSAALLAAFIANISGDTIGNIALYFVASRILHTAFYLANLDKLRSVSYLVSFGSCLCLFYMAISAL